MTLHHRLFFQQCGTVPEEETEEELEARLSLGEVVKVKSIQLWKQTLARHSHVKMGSYVGRITLPPRSWLVCLRCHKTLFIFNPQRLCYFPLYKFSIYRIKIIGGTQKLDGLVIFH